MMENIHHSPPSVCVGSVALILELQFLSFLHVSVALERVPPAVISGVQMDTGAKRAALRVPACSKGLPLCWLLRSVHAVAAFYSRCGMTLKTV